MDKNPDCGCGSVTSRSLAVILKLLQWSTRAADLRAGGVDGGSQGSLTASSAHSYCYTRICKRIGADFSVTSGSSCAGRHKSWMRNANMPVWKRPVAFNGKSSYSLYFLQADRIHCGSTRRMLGTAQRGAGES